MKKTYIPSIPRSRKLRNVGGGTINVSGGSAQNVPVIEGHTHDNKIILDAITQLHLRILSSLNVDEDGALIVELSNIIKELDTTVPTDENLFSALRTVLEIKARSISKTDPDTAQEIIKFVKGIEIGTFTTGPLGAGASLKMENGVSRLEIDQLDVRMRATFRELIIESLKHIGGQLILSPARMKCASVVDGGTYYKCYFDTGDGKVSNEFVAGDQARCQVFTGSGVKMYWRLVTSVGTDWINLSKTDAISGSSIPEAGDDIVQLGHRTDATRQNAQILSTVGSDAPSWKQYKGINAFSLEGKETTVFSGTGNRIDGKTVFMSSGANVEDGINSKNSNYSSQPTSYKANDTWTLSADTTVNGIAYKQGDILTATQDSTTFVQAHWVKKVRYTDDTAVNNMNIGSRNFWLNSALISKSATTAAWSIASRDLTGLIENGAQVTMQFDINVDAPFNIVLYAANQSPIVFGTTLLTNLANFNLVSGKQTIKHTFNFESSKPFIHIYKNSSELRTATVTNLMLGLGNKVTWSEAQEDIDLRINTAKQEALTAAGNAQTSANTANTAVGNLNTYVDGSFKDGVIEASEAKAIEKYINVVNTEKSNLEATYNTLYTNTYLEGTPKSDLLNAKVTYFGAVDTLLNSINTAITDGRTTIAEKQAVDTNYSSYKTALASLQTAIENANKAIQTKLDTLSTDRVNNLQIGFNNLLRLSNVPIVSVGTYLAGSYNRSGTFENGKTYTLVFKSTLNVRAFISSNVQIGNSVSGVNRMIFTYTGQALADQTIKFYNTSESYATQVTIDFACLYEGDVKAPSIWAESPADVQARIDAEKARIDNMLSDNIADPKEKQNLKLLWDEIAKEYPTIKSKAVSYGISTANYDSTYTALNNILSPLFVNMAINTSVVGTDVRTAYANYMEQKLLINQTITDTINGKANDAKLTAEQAQLAADGYMRARYVRDWLNGSSINTANTWNEIKIVNKSGTNLALGKTATSNDAFRLPVERITDNDTTTFSGTTYTSGVVTNTYIQIDLGQIYYDIDYIQIWHYYDDGRTYYGTKTEISEDGVNWTPVFDSAKSGTYKETAAGNIISQRWNRVMDRLNEAEAKTKFQTLIDGGLIYTALMKLFDTGSGNETAFISGLQGANKNLPAFGAGGSYAEALSGLAKAVIYHNGKSKFTDTEIEGIIKAISGEIAGFNIIGKSLISGTMQFTNSAIETLSQLLTPSNVSITNQTSWTSSVQNNSAHAYTQNFTLPNDGILKFEASAEHTGSYLQGGWDVHIEDANGGVVFSDTGDSGISSKPYQVNLESGTYSIHVQSYVLADAGQSFANIASISGESGSTTITIATFTNKTKIGNDGFFSFWGALNMLYYHATNGLTIRGTTDIPGVLAKGRIASNGARDTTKAWGAKNSTSSVTKPSGTGSYRVPVNCPNADYDVNISPRTANRLFYVGATTATYFDVYFQDRSGVAQDSDFSYTLVGNNY